MARALDAIRPHHAKRLSCAEAGELPGLSESHFRRLRDAYEEQGEEGLTGRRPGRVSGHGLLRKKALGRMRLSVLALRRRADKARRGGNKRHVNEREVVNGLMYVLSAGCRWRAIPKDLPPRSTAHDYLELWSWDGTLDRIHVSLYVKCREAALREASPTAAILDCQSVKSSEKGALRLIRRVSTPAKRLRARSDIFSSTRKAC